MQYFKNFLWFISGGFVAAFAIKAAFLSDAVKYCAESGCVGMKSFFHLSGMY